MGEMVTITREEYSKLLEAAEDLADIEAYDRARRDPGAAIPADSVRRMVDGESPLRVFRDLRGLTQMQLAERASVNRVQIADIEAGRKTGSVQTLHKLAEALEISIDDLV
ncbi:helix-turn-helix transcriptional regulator [Nitratireductor soli]|uniref:helix-turn-helix transcriptional regulator n=1 Tax=Nitratireductor soli TaxID=1670619 RepID=UPI00065E0A5C|nr:helix-turn-helix transcriptional regulator [Nitratireductor soli]